MSGLIHLIAKDEGMPSKQSVFDVHITAANINFPIFQQKCLQCQKLIKIELSEK